MKFTDRFIRLPVNVYSHSESELTGNKRYYPTFRKINPLEISEYGPGNAEEDRDDNFIHTAIEMKNGKSFLAEISIADFEKLLNEFGNK